MSPGGTPAVPHSADEVARSLAALGVRPSRGLGQSFLVDPFVADAEAALVAPSPGLRVLEIGGGLGILTEALVRRGAAPLTVVEKDARLARHLRRAFGTRVEVVDGDALEVGLPQVDVTVGNLPYAIATPLLLRFMAARVPRIVFLVQEEVARRFASAPGSKEYGRLSLVARLYGEVELFRTVPPAAFEPEPAVVSRLAMHTARQGPLPVPSVDRFETVVRVLFSSRRKQLRNLLPRLVSPPSDAGRVAELAGWPADWGRRRPETLPPEAFFSLAASLPDRSSAPSSPGR